MYNRRSERTSPLPGKNSNSAQGCHFHLRSSRYRSPQVNDKNNKIEHLMHFSSIVHTFQTVPAASWEPDKHRTFAVVPMWAFGVRARV